MVPFRYIPASERTTPKHGRNITHITIARRIYICNVVTTRKLSCFGQVTMVAASPRCELFYSTGTSSTCTFHTHPLTAPNSSFLVEGPSVSTRPSSDADSNVVRIPTNVAELAHRPQTAPQPASPEMSSAWSLDAREIAQFLSRPFTSMTDRKGRTSTGTPSHATERSEATAIALSAATGQWG